MTEIEFEGDRGGAWRYDPTRPLGPPGGFGRVFEGVDSAGTPVAVKEVPHREGVPPRLRIREKEIADKLQSVNAQYLIPVLDTGVVGDKFLLVMERADMSLADRMANEAPLPVNDASRSCDMRLRGFGSFTALRSSTET